MTKLKERIGKKILSRKMKGMSRDVRVHNFKTAKTAVILFDTGDPESFKVIKEFRNFMEGEKISCTTFGFVHQKEIPQELLFWKNYSFITRDDLNWYMKPSGESAAAFYAADPDLLIDFTLEAPLELQYLVQLSGARFKTGCFTEKENDYDLMISLTDNHEIGFLSEQFKRYIAMLNPLNEPSNE